MPFLPWFCCLPSVDRAFYAVWELRVKSDIEGAQVFEWEKHGILPAGQIYTWMPGVISFELRKDLADKSYYYYKCDIALKDGEIQTVEAQLKCVPNIESQMVLVKVGVFKWGQMMEAATSNRCTGVCI